MAEFVQRDHEEPPLGGAQVRRRSMKRRCECVLDRILHSVVAADRGRQRADEVGPQLLIEGAPMLALFADNGRTRGYPACAVLLHRAPGGPVCCVTDPISLLRREDEQAGLRMGTPRRASWTGQVAMTQQT